MFQEVPGMQLPARISQQLVGEIMEANRSVLPLARIPQHETNRLLATVIRLQLVKVAAEPLVPKREHEQQTLRFQQITTVHAAAIVLPETILLLRAHPAARLPVTVVILPVPLRQVAVAAVIHQEAAVEAAIRREEAVAAVAAALRPAVVAEGKTY